MKRTKHIVAAISIIILAFVGGMIVYNKYKDIEIAFLVTVSTLITSLISTILCELVKILILDEKIEQKQEKVQALNILSKDLSTLYNTVVNNEQGVKRFSSRKEYDFGFWKEFLDNANNQLTISGRTLNRWLDIEIKDSFTQKLVQLIKAKKCITLVIYKEESLKNSNTELDERNQLQIFLQENIFPEIHKIYSKGKKELLKNHFNIYEVNSLNYLYTSNENEVIVAPYYQYIDNKTNIMFVLDIKADFAKIYQKDFQYLLKDSTFTASNTWYSEWAKNQES